MQNKCKIFQFLKKKVSKQWKMINTLAKGIVKSDVWTEAKFKEAEDKKF